MVANKSSQKYRKVSEIIDTSFVSLDENTLVAVAAKALYEQEGGTLIVTRRDSKDDRRIPVGIITERDIIFRVVARNKGPFKITLKDVMSSPVITIESDKSIEEALDIFKKNKINRLPVVNNGAIIGLITTQMLAHKLPADRLIHSET